MRVSFPLMLLDIIITGVQWTLLTITSGWRPSCTDDG